MIVAVAGPKGGAGKTLIATSLALSLSNCRFLDCDVEEPNGHFYLRPAYRKRERVTLRIPQPKNWLGADLGAAAEFCPYHALAFVHGKLMVFDELCTGCGGCFLMAPKGALASGEREVGAVKTGDGRSGVEVVTGELAVGSQRTARVVAAVKAKCGQGKDTIIDCPPGTARPMLEAVRGCDYCLLVTECTPFGLEDLKAGIAALHLLGVGTGVVVNKARRGDTRVRKWCASEGINVLMEIPLSRSIATASSRGKTLCDVSATWAADCAALWGRIGGT